MGQSRFSLRARWVFPVDGDPIPGGVVTVSGGQIADVGAEGASPTHDLGNRALVPGFVNPHTHLEFSDLERPLHAPLPFDQWIRRLVAVRRDEGRDVAAAIRAGVEQCAQAGTTLVGEVASSPAQAAFLSDPIVRCVVFLELIGLDADRAATQEQQGARHLAQPPAANRIWGLSPHAPYSVRPGLLRESVRLAREHAAPLAIHLAETREEIELLSEGSGSLAAMLKDFGAWQPGLFDTPRRPLDLLREMADLPRGLIVHGNYLGAEEIAWLARRRDNLAVVYCPRSHRYFRHPEYPLRPMLAAGVALAIGTDSRASNPDLSVLDELRFLHQRYPDLPGSLLLRLGTLAGAAAMGQAEETGSLRPGKRADLAAIALPDREEHDPYRLLFASDLPVRATFSAGRCIFADLQGWSQNPATR